MTKFFVGQRVRVARTYSGRVPVGTPGVVVALGEHPAKWGKLKGTADCKVEVSGYPMPGGWSATFDQIEPILPEGAQPSKFSFHELMEDLNERSYEK